MYKIAILGCENSHAKNFLKVINENYSDVEVIGVFSEDVEAANKLKNEFGVNVAESYDEFVGKVDGIINTARHGDNHYKYLKPYIASGIPMFIDKPITVSEEEAKEFKAELIKNNIKISGGSTLKHPDAIAELKKAVAEKTYGEVYGGYLRSPISLENAYGDFFFYSQHLVQMTGEVFGYFPNSVIAFKNGNVVTCTVRYGEYDVNMEYVNGNYNYFASISCENDLVAKKVTLENAPAKEFAEFYTILTGGEQPQSYDEFFAPVYFMNALHRSLESGKEEKIKRG